MIFIRQLNWGHDPTHNCGGTIWAIEDPSLWTMEVSLTRTSTMPFSHACSFATQQYVVLCVAHSQASILEIKTHTNASCHHVQFFIIMQIKCFFKVPEVLVEYSKKKKKFLLYQKLLH